MIEKIKMEFIGTFTLCYMVTLFQIYYCRDVMDSLTMAISCFMVYSTLLWIGRSTSKSMYNPMITICTTISGHTNLMESIYMIGSQVLGALLALYYDIHYHPQIIIE